MKPSYCSQVLNILLLLVAEVTTSRAEVTGDLCPPGQVTHQEERSLPRCCLPVSCNPNYYVKLCSQNGTHDTCEPCPRSFALFKRTSSFALEPCHVFSLVHKNCSPLPGNPKATEEDRKNCYCDLESGLYYMKPQVPLGLTSYCQPLPSPCRKGEQPTQKGTCETCPKNTVQDVDDDFFFCRPQRNCSAMRLATEEEGNIQKETVCAKPPTLPSKPTPSSPKQFTTTPVPFVTRKGKKTTIVTSKNGVPPSVAPVLDDSANSGGFTMTHIIIVSVSGVALLILIILVVVYSCRKGLCGHRGSCHRHYDMESGAYPVNPTAPCDNDNASDDSCCACADSCLAASSKSGGGGGGKVGGACAPPPCKHPAHFPMLQGYMNGKCGHSLDSGPMSEPLYNSISHDEPKLSDGNMTGYINISGIPQTLNGVPPTLLKQQDFSSKPSEFDYNYPNKVRLPSVDSQEGDSLKKDPVLSNGQDCAGGTQARDGKDREDFTETDPLLPNLENASSNAPAPTGHPGLRGILRNSPVPQGRGEMDGREVGGGGNRPNLSMLLSSVEGASAGGGAGAPVANLPFLSQLVSSPHCVQGTVPPTHTHTQTPPQPAVQHQQLQHQAAPEPTQHVHELPPQLQRHLLQQQQQQQQQQGQEGSTLALRLMPTSAATQPQVNTSLVQMDELKPVMPLQPPPPTTTTTTVPAPPVAPATGAANVMEDKGRTGSPARINPSQQKEVRGGGGRETSTHRKASDVKATEEVVKSPEGAGPEQELNDETFRKQAMPAAPPPGEEEEEEETGRKSVGGSSGLGDSLDISSPLSLPSEDGRRSRSMYRRSNSEASRSVSPQLPLPPSRSISSPGDKNRPYAVVKPMQSDQSLNTLSSSPDQLRELTQPLDSAGRQFPLHSLRSHTPPHRQSSQESTDDTEESENA